MDLFEFDFFRDWELEQQCHYEQDRSVLKKKEWERRTQEVQQDEDLFSSGFNLFGEPYKTNKGDALANRVQNTLGNYDEMKELLTSHSNQSHLVGIPKNLIPQTPIEKDGYLRFFPDGQKSIVALSQQSTSLQSTSMPPPPCPVLTSSSLLHDHQGTKVSNSSDWTRGGHNSGCMQTSHAVGYSNHKIKNGVSSIEYNGHEDQGDTSSVASSSSSRRHTQQSKSPCADHTNKENNNTLSPKEQEFVPHSSSSPVASTSLLSSAPNFCTGLHYKPSVVQQKPTAYVRPMDGQDQITNDSPELKPHMEIGDHAPEFGRLMEEKVDAKVKSKLPRLTLPQSGEVSLLNDSSCIEEILREMTHSWPPPLSGIHTPGKADQPKFPLPSKEPQNLIPGYNGQKLCNAPGKKPPDLPTPHKSMLEDDLKLSSDEDESELAEEKTKPKSAHLKLPGSTDEISQLGQVNGASGSSTESESSSESDSDSESSSSESEGNRESLCATPEPEPPSTNKWQLDKWLNKVNPQNKVLISTQVDSHGIASSQSEVELGLCNTESTMSSAQPETKDRVLLSPIQEKAKFKTGQMTPDLKGGKLRSPATELPVPGKMTGKKLPRKLESVPTLDDDIILKPCKVISPSPKEKEPPPVELSRARNKIGGGKSAPRKEPRPLVTATALSDKKKQRGPNKIIPKSKEFIETESSSSECHSDAEEQVKNFSNTQQHKDKENTDNVQMISNLNNAGNTLVLDASVDLIDDVLYSTSKQMDTVRSGLLLGHFEEIRSLWVKIDLCLLTRIPGKDPCDPLPIETRTWENRNLQLLMATNPACKSKRKSKSKNCGAVSGKKIRLEKGALLLPPCISPKHSHKPSTVKESLKKQPKKKDEKLLPPSLTPLLGEQDQVYRADEGSTYSQENSTIPDISSCPNSTFLQSCLASSVSSSSTKHRKSDTKGPNNETDICSKPAETVCSHIQESDLWLNPTIPPELLEPRRPKLVFDDIVHKADHYMLEAKKLKHKADALMEKFGKALNYTDGALSFIECGNAMERDPLEAKSPYTMYSETVELIRYAMRLKNFTSQSATVAEKKLAVLCYRCLSLLYLRMFRLKKDHAVKYSRTLMEYFKKSSPWGSNGKVTSSPLPLSLSSSPGSSVGSSNSIPPGPCSAGTVTIPQRIHHMAASHVNITTNILRSYEHWDTADKLSQESKEFFQELNLTMEPLTQHSTMTELVRYVRQGLHWLRIEARLL